MVDRKLKKIYDKKLAQSILEQLQEIYKGTEYEDRFSHIAKIESKNKCYDLKYLQYIAGKVDKKIIIKFVDIEE